MLKAILITLCLSICAAAQETTDKPQPDRWRGLVINESTAEDAIKTLGQPKKDKPGGLRTYPLNKRLIVDHNSKEFRKLTYEKLTGVKKAELLFKDEKLVMIELHPEKSIQATTFPDLYGIMFTPKISGMDQAFSPNDYERNKGNVYPMNYPVTYHLVAVTDSTYVSAFVDNSSVGSILFGSRRDKTGENDKGGFPGKVQFVQLISRTLENRSGAEALK